MNRTQIEWVKNPDGSQGYTWNPITGCLNHTPEGLCLGGGFPCYAYKLANGRLKQRYLANESIAPFNFSSYESLNILDRNNRSNPFYPRFWIDRAGENFGSCYAGAEPKGIFVCDMSDLFGIGVPKEWTQRILNKIGMSYYREHRFYLLTKQPQNLPKFSPFPNNCWVGVTATNRGPLLAAINSCQFFSFEASIKFASLEPLLGKIGSDLLQYIDAFQWVIIGAQTKPYKPPQIEWVEEIVRACDKAGVKVFLKDNLRPLLPNRMPFYDVVSYWSADRTHKLYENRLRQEMPSE